MVDQPLNCWICQRDLLSQGHGYDPQHRLWVHVGCYHDWVHRHRLTPAPLEHLGWSVGERVSLIHDGQLVTGEIVSVGGGVVRVRVSGDRAITVDAAALQPARW